MWLSSLGLFAIINQSVRRREREVAVRLAIGGTPREVLGRFVRDGLTLCATGLTLGIIASLAATGLLQSLLFGVGRADVTTCVVVSTVLLISSAVAIWWPARRVTRVDLAAPLRAH